MITVTVALRCLESPAYQMFAQERFRANHKRRVKALHLWAYLIGNHRCTGYASKLSLMREACPYYNVMFLSTDKTDALEQLKLWVCIQNGYGSSMLATLDMMTSCHGYPISSASLPLYKEVHWSKVVFPSQRPSTVMFLFVSLNKVLTQTVVC